MARSGSIRSVSVPKGWESFYGGMTDQFCRRHLNDEYAELLMHMLPA